MAILTNSSPLQVDKAWACGDVQTAREKSRNAKIANIIEVALVVTGVLLSVHAYGSDASYSSF